MLDIADEHLIEPRPNDEILVAQKHPIQAKGGGGRLELSPVLTDFDIGDEGHLHLHGALHL